MNPPLRLTPPWCRPKNRQSSRYHLMGSFISQSSRRSAPSGPHVKVGLLNLYDCFSASMGRYGSDKIWCIFHKPISLLPLFEKHLPGARFNPTALVTSGPAWPQIRYGKCAETYPPAGPQRLDRPLLEAPHPWPR